MLTLKKKEKNKTKNKLWALSSKFIKNTSNLTLATKEFNKGFIRRFDSRTPGTPVPYGNSRCPAPAAPSSPAPRASAFPAPPVLCRRARQRLGLVGFFSSSQIMQQIIPRPVSQAHVFPKSRRFSPCKVSTRWRTEKGARAGQGWLSFPRLREPQPELLVPGGAAGQAGGRQSRRAARGPLPSARAL